MQALMGQTSLAAPVRQNKLGSAKAMPAALARPAARVISARNNGVQVVASDETAMDRRAVLRATVAGLVGAGALSVSESAQAINTYTTPKPFVTDYEKYKDRVGATLSPPQMGRIRGEFRDIAKATLMEAVPKMPNAYPGLLKLAYVDAATFDIWQIAGKNAIQPSGGSNGSVRYSEEMNRPEMASLKSLMDMLEPVKADIDSKWAAHAADMGSPRTPDAISWSDLIAMAAVVATIQKWGDSPEGGFPVRQGRTDVLTADPASRVLPFDSDVTTAKAWAKKRGIPTKNFIPIWMEITDNMDSVKADGECQKLMATYEADPAQYQKDFVYGFTQLTSLGAKYDAYAYFYDESPFKGKENLAYRQG